MSARELTEAQASRLMELVATHLREAQLEAPLEGEWEPAYVARCVIGPVRRVIEELKIPGLIVAGEGGGSVAPVPLFGLLFYPDLTVSFYKEKTIAFEAKFLGELGRQTSVATGLGQAYLYRRAGYRHTGALLIDLAGAITDDEIKQAEDVCRTAAIEVIVRRKVGGLLAEHPR